MIPLERDDDPRVELLRLRERGLTPRTLRREHTPAGRFVAEGDLVVERALAAGCRPLLVLTDPERPAEVAQRLDASGQADVFTAPADLRSRVTGLGVSLDVIAVFERPAPRTPGDVVAASQSLLVVEAVDNPTNVGAVVRSAVALGVDGLLLDRTCADPLARRALRVAMGTALALPHARVADVAEAIELLHADGVATVALTPDPAAPSLDEVAATVAGQRTALFLGAERTGLTDEALRGVHHRARIPMAAGVDSLNVAAAAAVACYALRPHRS